MNKLASGREVTGDTRALDIVLIPGIDTASPAQWQGTSGSWLMGILSNTASQAQIWEYRYALPDSDTSFVEKLLDEGYNLLNELLKLPRYNQLPTLFICHSLGGLILKKSLCIARQQLYRYREVIDVVSGIIFFSVPHATPDTVDRTNVLEHIHHSRQKPTYKAEICNKDRDSFRFVCREFEVIRMQVPILSVYEGKETKIYDKTLSNLRKPRQLIIVDKLVAQVNAKSEEMIEADANHHDICLVKVGDNLYRTLDLFLQKVVEEAPRQVEERFRAYEAPLAFDQQTLRSQSSWEPSLQDLSQLVSTTQEVRTSGITTEPSEAQPESRSTAASYEATGRRNPQLPCFSVKPYKRNEHFFGRQREIELIDKAFFPTNSGDQCEYAKPLKSFGICGMGSMGKTQIAVEYAYTRRDRFDAIFWLHADESNVLGESFANIARQLGLEDPSEVRDLTVSRERVLGWLSHPLKRLDNATSPENEAKWLIIFDNVDRLSVLEDHWPVTGNGCVLVTSRDPQAMESWYTPNTGINLDKLSIDETVEMLRSMTKATRDYDSGKSLNLIANKLDGYPLAIERVAGIIREVRVSYSEFEESYERAGAAFIHRIQAQSPEQPYQNSLATVWALEELPPQSLALLEVMSLLDADRIPESVLRQGLKEVHMKHYPRDDWSYCVARQGLLKSSLVKQNEGKELYLHRLVQDVARSGMNKPRLFEAFEAALQLVGHVWPFQNMKSGHLREEWQECASLYPQVLRLKQVVESITPTGTAVYDSIELAALLGDAGLYLFEGGFIEEPLEYFETAQKICEASKEKSSEVVSALLRECHHNQGTAAAEMNDKTGALNHQKIWLEMMLQRSSQSGMPIRDYELSITYNELGVAHAFNDNYEEAIKCFLESKNIMTSLENFTDTMLGWPLPNLGFMYWVQGRYEEAEKVLREILSIHQRVYGTDDVQSFRTGKILHALGNVMASRKLMEESLNFHSRALKQYRVSQGNRHHRTADVCHRVADHYIKRGRHSDAEPLIEQALRVFNSRPCYQNETARTTYKKAQLRVAQGRTEEAAECFSEAYTLRRKLVPQDHRTLEELNEEHFDSLVIFWSR